METNEWEKEFERLMPKTAGETMSYGQFCAVREWIRTKFISISELKQWVEENRIDSKGWSSTSQYGNDRFNSALKALKDRFIKE